MTLEEHRQMVAQTHAAFLAAYERRMAAAEAYKKAKEEEDKARDEWGDAKGRAIEAFVGECEFPFPKGWKPYD